MEKYLKYACCNSLCLAAVLSFAWGGTWMYLPFFLVLVTAIVGDGILPEDNSQAQYGQTWILNAFLYANLPLIFAAYLLFFLRLGIWNESGAAVALGSHIFEGSRLATRASDIVGGALGLGLIFGIAATNVAHELVHRTWSPWAQRVGHFLLAFTWDGQFAIEHVYGHHRKVSTFEDPASARRGESFYRFFPRSLIGCTASAWKIEKDFLKKRNLRTCSSANRLLRSWTISLGLAVLSVILAGLPGLLLHGLLALYGKTYLELVNYIEHYGLVRIPKTAVHPRHSWNSNAPISSWFLYNLTRHSHHHAVGHLPYWRLNPGVEAPCLPFGYMNMILLALVPPLFKKLMEPHLANWDRTFASREERGVHGLTS